MPAIPISRPPVATPVERWLLSDYTELATMRMSLRRALDAQTDDPGGEYDDTVEDMILVATELATNALTHAGPPAVMQLSCTTRSFILDVADSHPSGPPVIDTGRAPGAGGLGLKLTDDLAGDTGWYTTDDQTKHVWALFARPRRRRITEKPGISVDGLARVIQSLSQRRRRL
jgi:serine/threonine-protein kinase RsbW